MESKINVTGSIKDWAEIFVVGFGYAGIFIGLVGGLVYCY